MYTTLTFLGKRVIQTNPSKFDERLFSDIYLCRLRLKQGRIIIKNFMHKYSFYCKRAAAVGLRERERERDTDTDTDTDFIDTRP